MWTLHKQQQNCGAQLHARGGPSTGSGPRKAGEAPAEAVSDRAAQDNDRVGDTALQPGDYPASAIENRRGDTSPTAPGDSQVDWDEVVQPERRPTELEQDESDDASKRERAIELDEDEPGAKREGPES
jgi:hypothetical protein